MRKLFLTLTTMVMAVAILNAQKQDIKLRVQVGQKVPLRFQQMMDQEVSFGGQTMKTKTTTKYEFAFSVVAYNGENLVIDAIVNKAELVATSDQGNITASSTDSTDTQYNKELKEIAGKVVRAEVTPYFELVGEPKATDAAISAATAKKIFEAMASCLKGLYPKQPVAQGDSWEDTVFGDNKAKSTLSLVGDNSYVIDSKIRTEQSMQGITLSGDGILNYEIHKATGAPIYGLYTLPLTGSMVAQGTTVNVKINITGSFEFIQ
ncbi:MAG: hypothetical protein PUI84_05495 [Bacteroidales bacterium]|nr:hypothetical protein [Porphyromonas sp.]MDD6934757.1 hypothetical protein [Bacteroidales bacterium]MDY3102753.1 hypothetical protein [Porphyromonas sp.]